MTPNFLAYVRIFEYILVIVAAMFLIRKEAKSVIYVANILVAAFLCYNAVQYVLGVPNTQAFQVSITLFVGLWALAHLMELFRRV